MTSKAQKRRNKRKHKPQIQEYPRPQEPVIVEMEPSNIPTDQRLAVGSWVQSQKIGRITAPMVDTATDMIGELHAAKKLTSQHVEAARVFQELRSSYEAELAVPGYKSCLAGGSGGYDDGEGNPEVMRAYREMERRVGRIVMACLTVETAKLAGEKPRDLQVLINSLNVVGQGA